MVEILIDNQRCDLGTEFRLGDEIFTFDAEAFHDLDVARKGRQITLRLPLSPQNDRIMGFAADPTSATAFNSSHHAGRIVVDGVELFVGSVTLQAIEGKQEKGEYVVEIRDGAGDWVERIASRTLAEAPLGFEATLNYQTIEDSWQGEKTVRFLPVRHDDYREPYDSSSLYAPQRVMTVADYHPFISVRDMLHAIFEGAGYNVQSQFLDSDMVRKLYFSGCYPKADSSLTRLENSSGFMAGRTSEATTTADAMGRAWMTPLVLTSSLGNFVQTSQGGELYNNRGVLTIGEEGVEYHPKVEANVGFEIFLKYSTEYRITSSSRLQGFDRLYVDTGCDLEIPLANPHKDRRGNLTAGVQYKCFVFDIASGTTLRLIYRSAGRDTLIKSITASETTFTMPSLSGGEALLLTSSGEEYAGDWAIYDGYVAATGVVDVEVTLQTPPEHLTPSRGKEFTKMYLHGAEQGQRVTLSSLCTLRPLFYSSPAAGSVLSTESILAHEATQREFVEAVQQMFNLQIATCEASKIVYIEPYDDFYDGELRDVSIYVDRSKEIRATDLAAEVRRNRTLCYRAEGDGAVTRYNAQSGEIFGQWSTTIESQVATMGRERKSNPLFCPTISATGIYASAPSASIMQVGDRDADSVGEVSMRVVRYEGMRPLPEGERWGAPSFGGEYPYAAFHSPGEFTLCFEDRDGASGLYSYYLREWLEQAMRRRLSVHLTLPAHALPPLSQVQQGGGTRLRYRLNIAGQRATYYLRKVRGYDATTRSAHCEFVRMAED